MIRMRTLSRVMALAVTLAAVGCQSAPGTTPVSPDSPEPLHEAMQQLTNTMVYDIFSPPQASRVYSYASVAAYEAIRQGDTTWRSLAGQVRQMPAVPQPEAQAQESSL